MQDKEELWLTYAEAGEMLGISTEAARAMARRQNWPRRTPNEHNALARVMVPSDRPIVRPRPAAGQGMNGGHPGNGRRAEELLPGEHDRPGDRLGVLQAIRETLEVVMAPIHDQLRATNQRADHERNRAEEAERRADEAELKADVLQAKLEAGQLAEQLARDEAAELRQRLDALRMRGWWARLRNK